MSQIKTGDKVRVIGEPLTELPKYVVDVTGDVAVLCYSQTLRGHDFAEYARNLTHVDQDGYPVA